MSWLLVFRLILAGALRDGLPLLQGVPLRRIRKLLTISLSLCGVVLLVATVSAPSWAPNSTVVDSAIYLPLVLSPPMSSTWEEVGAGSASGGGISNSGNADWVPSMAIAPDGTPYVAWMDESNGNWEIYVRRWNGITWEEVGEGSASGGGISNNSGSSSRPSMAVSHDGSPYVAWEDNSNGTSEIYVRRWSGNIWEEVGTGSASDGGISKNGVGSFDSSMSIALDDTPYVAWYDNAGSSGDYHTEIYVRRWNGITWEEVGTGSASGGGISNTVSLSFGPSLAIAPDGTPYVAWQDSSIGGWGIYVRRWNGYTWEEVGAGSASGGGIGGSSWIAGEPSLDITSNNTPYVSWSDFRSGDSEVYVRRWNGNTWAEVGAGSASGGGISNNISASGWSSLKVAYNDTPYVAWSDWSADHNDVYVLRWNGSTWEEVGTGSASDGGISNNSGGLPSLAIDPSGVPYAAYLNVTDVSRDIYVRRWVAGTP